MTPPYEMIELLVTLRCNVSCPNCIRLCNTEAVTGLDYEGLDLTPGQVERFLQDVEAVGARTGARPVTGMVVLTGGEPTLHRDIIPIAQAVDRRLVQTGLAGGLMINSNLLRPPPPEIQPWVVNFTPLSQKAAVHSAVLLAPPDPPPVFDACRHYRKWRVEVSAHGYSLCCAAGGYLRLFGLTQLYSAVLPDRPEEFAFLPQMNDVCRHCAFGGPVQPESLVGRPVSPVYQAAAQAGRRVTCRLPEAETEPH